MINAEVHPRTLGFVRAYVFAIWLVKIVPDPLPFFAEFPRLTFERVGILRLASDHVLNILLTAKGLGIFKGVLVCSLVFAMIGVRPYRPVAMLAAVLLTVHQALV